MKLNATILATSLLALSAPLAAQWSDNFDAYAANTQLYNVGGWTGWDNAAAAAATVDGTRWRSFPNSLLVGGSTDAVHPGIGATGGKWTVTAWQFIPTGGLVNDVYFILNNVYNHGGPYSWTGELKCDHTTNTVVDDLRTHTPQPLVFDQWVEYRLDIDLDANTVSSYYNGGLISSGTYASGTSPRAIQNIDLFSTGGTCNWDDVQFAWRGDSFETYPAGPLYNVGGWTGWDNIAAAAGSLDTTRARTGVNSLLVGATTDAVRPNIGITSGRWSLTAWQYIPTGGLVQDVYFIINNVYNHGGPYSWTGELKCDHTTNTVVDDLRAHNAQPIVFDQWVQYRFDIDLDANTMSTYYNGGLLSSGVYASSGPRAIQNLDLFSTGGTCNWDDFDFSEVTAPPCYEANIGTALGLGDDAVAARPLGFTFPFPGGSTTDISICSNGFVWLDGTTTITDYSGSVAEFLGSVTATPRICAAWRDFNPAATGSDDVYFNTFVDRAVITWHNVVRYSGSAPMTVQLQLLADGSVYVYWDAAYDMTGGTSTNGTTLVGIKPATGATVDPGMSDFTARAPFSTSQLSPAYEFFADSANFDLAARSIRFEMNTFGGYDVSFRADCRAAAVAYGTGCPAAAPLTLGASAAPVLGSTISLNITNAPSPAGLIALLLGLESDNFSLGMFGWTGCSSYTQMNFWAAVPGTSVPFTIATDPLLIGASIYSQAITVDATGNLYASNGLRLGLGKN